MVSRRFYWLRHIKLQDSGALTVKMTGYDEDTTHWIDYLTVEPSEADYPFWLWLRQIKVVEEVLDDLSMVALRDEFERTLRQRQSIAA
jgi:hypothetical protein